MKLEWRCNEMQNYDNLLKRYDELWKRLDLEDDNVVSIVTRKEAE